MIFKRVVCRTALGTPRMHSNDDATMPSDSDNNLPNLLLLEGFNPLTVFSFGEFLTLSCVVLTITFVAFKTKFLATNKMGAKF